MKTPSLHRSTSMPEISLRTETDGTKPDALRRTQSMLVASPADGRNLSNPLIDSMSASNSLLDSESTDIDTEGKKASTTDKKNQPKHKEVERTTSGRFSHKKKAKIHALGGGILLVVGLGVGVFFPPGGALIAFGGNTLLSCMHGGRTFQIPLKKEEQPKEPPKESPKEPEEAKEPEENTRPSQPLNPESISEDEPTPEDSSDGLPVKSGDKIIINGVPYRVGDIIEVKPTEPKEGSTAQEMPEPVNVNSTGGNTYITNNYNYGDTITNNYYGDIPKQISSAEKHLSDKEFSILRYSLEEIRKKTSREVVDTSEAATPPIPEQSKGYTPEQIEPDSPSVPATGVADEDGVGPTPDDQSADPSVVTPQSSGTGDSHPVTDKDAQTDKTKTPSGALGWVKNEKGTGWKATEEFRPTQTPEGPYRGKNYEADRNGDEPLHNAPFIKPAVGKTAEQPASTRDGTSETATPPIPEQSKGYTPEQVETDSPSVPVTGVAEEDSVGPTPDGQSADPSVVTPQSSGTGDSHPVTDKGAQTDNSQTPNNINKNSNQSVIPSELPERNISKDREFSAEIGSEIVGNTHVNEVKLQVGAYDINDLASEAATQQVDKTTESKVSSTHISFIKKDVNISPRSEPELQSVSVSNHTDNLVQGKGVSDKSAKTDTFISSAHIDIKMPVDTSKPNRVVSNTYGGRLERQQINGQTKWVLTNAEGERGNKTVVLSHGSSVSAMARNYTKLTKNGEPLFHNVVDINQSKLLHVESINGFLANTNETYKSFFDRHLTSPRRDENLKWVS